MWLFLYEVCVKGQLWTHSKSCLHHLKNLLCLSVTECLEISTRTRGKLPYLIWDKHKVIKCSGKVFNFWGQLCWTIQYRQLSTFLVSPEESISPIVHPKPIVEKGWDMSFPPCYRLLRKKKTSSSCFGYQKSNKCVLLTIAVYESWPYLTLRKCVLFSGSQEKRQSICRYFSGVHLGVSPVQDTKKTANPTLIPWLCSSLLRQCDCCIHQSVQKDWHFAGKDSDDEDQIKEATKEGALI